MNCRIIDYGTYKEVQVSLSDRNLRALEASREPIGRDTKINDQAVRLLVRSESDTEHYYSTDRDEDAIGEAGKLHRLGDVIENAETVYVEIPYKV